MNKNNTNEKKCILYLIIIAICLIYLAIFFIHYIVDNGTAKDSATAEIEIDNTQETENIDNTQENKNTDNTDSVIVDNSDRFKIKQGNTEWKYLSELDMFKNFHFEDRAIIAPGVFGSYSYTVENESDSDFIYYIRYQEQNPYKVNMKYKLRVNGNYIVGEDGEWHDYKEMERTDVYIKANSKDIYTVEWKWVDAENDTEVGTTEGANYKMHIDIVANQVME